VRPAKAPTPNSGKKLPTRIGQRKIRRPPAPVRRTPIKRGSAWNAVSLRILRVIAKCCRDPGKRLPNPAAFRSTRRMFTISDTVKLLGSSHGQRLQHDCVHQGEDGRGRADAERECQRDRERETGRAADLANRVGGRLGEVVRGPLTTSIRAAAQQVNETLRKAALKKSEDRSQKEVALFARLFWYCTRKCVGAQLIQTKAPVQSVAFRF